MIVLNRSDSSNDPSNKLLEITNKLAKMLADDKYIYRGERKHYDKVSSGLYRQCQDIDIGSFDVEVVQEEILDQAKEYITHTGKREIEVFLAELQHFGKNEIWLTFNTLEARLIL